MPRKEKKENKNNKQKNNKKNSEILYYLLITVLTIILIGGCVFVYFYSENKNEEKQLSYTQLIKDIEEEKIEKVEMTYGSSTAKIKYKDVEEEKTVSILDTEAFAELIQNKTLEGKNIELIQKPVNVMLKISSILFQYLPTLLLVAMIIMLFKMQGIDRKSVV